MPARKSDVPYVVDGNGCWIWQLARNSRGYGQLWDKRSKRLVAAHRWHYELAKGPIPPGMWIDHRCGTKACVNPAHLEAVTPRTNAERYLYPDGRPLRASEPPDVRVVDTTDCILWQRARDGRGYGATWDGRRVVGAHRWAYEQAYGPIPDGLEIDHLCRTPLCVNPDHLEAVTPQENKRRAQWRASCKRGHPLTPENSNWSRTTGKRTCRTCKAERSARYRRQLREGASSGGRTQDQDIEGGVSRGDATDRRSYGDGCPISAAEQRGTLKRPRGAACMGHGADRRPRV